MSGINNVNKTFYTIVAVFSAEPDAQDRMVNSQDTNRLRILTGFRKVTEVRHQSSFRVFWGDFLCFYVSQVGGGVIRVREGKREALPQPVLF